MQFFSFRCTKQVGGEEKARDRLATTYQGFQTAGEVTRSELRRQYFNCSGGKNYYTSSYQARHQHFQTSSEEQRHLIHRGGTANISHHSVHPSACCHPYPRAPVEHILAFFPDVTSFDPTSPLTPSRREPTTTSS